MIVDIKQKHIDKGRPGSKDICAVALAVWDLGFEDVDVGNKYIRVKKDGFWISYRQNTVVMNFIGNYDQGITVIPLITELTDTTLGFMV